MVYTMERILRRFGSTLILQRGDSRKSFRGFLQHSDSKSWQNMEAQFGPLGEIPRGQYVLLAPLEPGIRAGDTLIGEEKNVTVRRIETVMYKDRPLYRWGLCVGKGDGDCWGS